MDKDTVQVLSRAFCIISDRWTNRGFKIKQEDGSYKVDVIGAIAIAREQLFNLSGSDSYRDSDLAINLINETAMMYFHRSAISVNDDLGYVATVKLFALTIERGIRYAFGLDSNTRRLEHKANRSTPRTSTD